MLTFKLNTYFATLLITIAGAGAALLIVRVADTVTFSFENTDAASYASLQRSILTGEDK